MHIARAWPQSAPTVAETSPFKSVASTSSQGPICRSLLAHHVAPPGTPAHRPPTQRRPFPASARQPHYCHGTRLFASAIQTLPVPTPNNHPESCRDAAHLAPLSLQVRTSPSDEARATIPDSADNPLRAAPRNRRNGFEDTQPGRRT